MWIKIFPINPEKLDKEGKEEESAPVLLNLDHLIMVEENSDYLALYVAEIEEPLLISIGDISADRLDHAVHRMNGALPHVSDFLLDNPRQGSEK